MAENQEQIVQDLKIHLRGGQTVDVNFKAEKADVLNPQIEAFLKALGDKEKREGNFLFQARSVGGRVCSGSDESHRKGESIKNEAKEDGASEVGALFLSDPKPSGNFD